MSAFYLQSMPTNWSPWFDVCHFILAALAVRKEVGLSFSRLHPLATWTATMTASFAGSLITNPLLGKPVFAAISNEYNMMLFTVIWWAVFYSPGDIAYSVVSNQVLYYPICVIKEIYRAKKTLGGIVDAGKIFPDQELIQIVVGVIKGNGSGFMKPITRLVCGNWTPDKSELLGLSVTSKECLVAAMLLVADRQSLIPDPLAGDLLYISIVSTFVVVKLSTLLSQPIDPFRPLDTAVAFVTGGLSAEDDVKEE